MSNNLNQEKKVSRLIESAIREITGKVKNILDMNALRSAKSLEEVFKIIKAQGLEQGDTARHLGVGSSRTVFLLSPKKVLKVAKNQKGTAQNRNEAAVSAKYPELFPKVYEADPKGKWLISELVRELRSDEEFTRLTGLNMDHMYYYYLKTHATAQERDEIEGDVFKDVRKKITQQKLEDVELSDWAEKIFDIMKKENLSAGDALNFKHWGITGDGRLVMFDAGLNLDIWNKFYR